ncbi:MAG: hypothetical protein ACOC95_09840 [Planctomycetota bacterium]
MRGVLMLGMLTGMVLAGGCGGVRDFYTRSLVVHTRLPGRSGWNASAVSVMPSS